MLTGLFEVPAKYRAELDRQVLMRANLVKAMLRAERNAAECGCLSTKTMLHETQYKWVEETYGKTYVRKHYLKLQKLPVN